MDAQELIQKYGKRYAFEWFMRAEDERHHKLAMDYIDRKCKKITAIAATNAVMTIFVILIILKHLRSQ